MAERASAELILDISDVNNTIDEIRKLIEVVPDIPEDVERDIEKVCLVGGDAFAIIVSSGKNVIRFEAGYLLVDVLMRLRKRMDMFSG